jgi:hypothetical protein
VSQTRRRPTEPVWSHLKRSLANLVKRNLAQMTALVKTRLRRMQYRSALLEGFVASTGLDLTPFCNPPPVARSAYGRIAAERYEDATGCGPLTALGADTAEGHFARG